MLAYITTATLLAGCLSSGGSVNAQTVADGQTQVESVVQGKQADNVTATPAVTSSGAIVATEVPMASAQPTTGAAVTETPDPTTGPAITEAPIPTVEPTESPVETVTSAAVTVQANQASSPAVVLKGKQIRLTADLINVSKQPQGSYQWQILVGKKWVTLTRQFKKATLKKRKIKNDTCTFTIDKMGIYRFRSVFVYSKQNKKVYSYQEETEVSENNQPTEVLVYTKTLSATLDKSKKLSKTLSQKQINKLLFGTSEEKDLNTFGISYQCDASKLPKTSKYDDKKERLTIGSYPAAEKIAKALQIKLNGKKLANVTIKVELPKISAKNVRMKLSRNNTLLRVTFYRVDEVSQINFGPTGKKADVVKKAKIKKKCSVLYFNRYGFKSKKFEIQLGYKVGKKIYYSGKTNVSLKK